MNSWLADKIGRKKCVSTRNHAPSTPSLTLIFQHQIVRLSTQSTMYCL